MSGHSNRPDNPAGRLIVTGLIGYGLWHYPLSTLYDPLLRGLWWFGAFLVALGCLKSLPMMTGNVAGIWKLFRVFQRDTTKGSAGFMTERELRRARLHRRKRGARFIGTVGSSALWLWTETHHLIVGPSGSSKTSAAIINILMGSPESALINDTKGELYETTKEYRAKAFGHEILVIDPQRPEESIKFNPLDDVAEGIAADDPGVLSRIRGIAFQLLPDPQGGGGSNAIFYQGGRTLLTTTALAVCVVLPPEHRTLAMVYRALSDLEVLHDLFDKASRAGALNGEIADMARSAHQMAFGDGGTAKTFESFRTNALQAMEAFGPGNYLAAITSETTFHFRELKERKVSLYIKIDYANAKVLSAFSGLVQHLAAEAMVASGNNIPVTFCLDEFVNSPFMKLCQVLTLLRSSGVRVIMATQDLNDIERVYSKNDLETVLSEAHIKQFLGGIRAKKTLDWLAAYLGEYTETVSSFSFGREGPQESVSRANRHLLNADELRRLPDAAQIVLYGNHQPILAKKVQVFAIAPWRRKLGINRTYGTKRKLLPVEVRVRWWGTEVTPRAVRAHKRLQRAIFHKRGQSGRLWTHLAGRLPLGVLLALGLAVAVLLHGPGLPNLRWTYTYIGAREAPTTFVWCRYVGPTSPGTIRGPRCPLILWRKP